MSPCVAQARCRDLEKRLMGLQSELANASTDMAAASEQRQRAVAELCQATRAKDAAEARADEAMKQVC